MKVYTSLALPLLISRADGSCFIQDEDHKLKAAAVGKPLPEEQITFKLNRDDHPKEFTYTSEKVKNMLPIKEYNLAPDGDGAKCNKFQYQFSKGIVTLSLPQHFNILYPNGYTYALSKNPSRWFLPLVKATADPILRLNPIETQGGSIEFLMGFEGLGVPQSIFDEVKPDKSQNVLFTFTFGDGKTVLSFHLDKKKIHPLSERSSNEGKWVFGSEVMRLMDIWFTKTSVETHYIHLVGHEEPKEESASIVHG
ncbi:hypothetical protein ABG067_007358 [Albugo candida]